MIENWTRVAILEKKDKIKISVKYNTQQIGTSKSKEKCFFYFVIIRFCTVIVFGPKLYFHRCGVPNGKVKFVNDRYDRTVQNWEVVVWLSHWYSS